MSYLLTLEEYKTFKGKNIANQNEDGRLTINLHAVSDFVRQYLSRNLTENYATDAVEYFAGNTHFVNVREWPIRAVVSVEYKDAEGVYQALESFYVDEPIGCIESTDGYNFTDSRDSKFLRVTYKGGYAECPNDIKMAIADLVEKQIKQEHSITKTVGGQDTMTYPAQPIHRLPNHIAVVLDSYRMAL